MNLSKGVLMSMLILSATKSYSQADERKLQDSSRAFESQMRKVNQAKSILIEAQRREQEFLDQFKQTTFGRLDPSKMEREYNWSWDDLVNPGGFSDRLNTLQKNVSEAQKTLSEQSEILEKQFRELENEVTNMSPQNLRTNRNSFVTSTRLEGMTKRLDYLTNLSAQHLDKTRELSDALGDVSHGFRSSPETTAKVKEKAKQRLSSKDISINDQEKKFYLDMINNARKNSGLQPKTELSAEELQDIQMNTLNRRLGYYNQSLSNLDLLRDLDQLEKDSALRMVQIEVLKARLDNTALGLAIDDKIKEALKSQAACQLIESCMPNTMVEEKPKAPGHAK